MATAQENNFNRQENIALSAISLGIDGKTCLIGSEDGTIYLRNLITGKIEEVYVHHKNAVTSLVYLNEKTFLSSGLDGNVCKWSLNDSTPISVWSSPDGKYVSNLTLNESRAWIASSFKTIYFADGNRKIEQGVSNVFCLTPTGNNLVTINPPFTISIFDIESAKSTSVLDVTPAFPGQIPEGWPIISIDISPDSSRILVLMASRHESVCATIELDTGLVDQVIGQSEKGSRKQAVFSPTGRYVLLVGFDVSIFDSASGELIGSIQQPETEMAPMKSYFSAIAFKEDEQRLRVYATTTSGQLRTFSIEQVVQSKNGKKDENKVPRD